MPSVNNNNSTAAATAASSSSSATGTSQSTAPTSIRRNLFHHHLNRRPPSSSTTTGATSATGNNGVSTIRNVNLGSKAAADAAVTTTADNNTDIVVRDKNGGYRIDVPMLPPGIVGDDGNSPGIEGMDSAEVDGKISEREKDSTGFFRSHWR